MVHLHSPLLPRPPAPPLPPALGDSPLGKSKLEMSPLEPLRVPPHVSSAVSHQREKNGRGGVREEQTHGLWVILDLFLKVQHEGNVTAGIKHLYLSSQINTNQRRTDRSSKWSCAGPLNSLLFSHIHKLSNPLCRAYFSTTVGLPMTGIARLKGRLCCVYEGKNHETFSWVAPSRIIYKFDGY